MKTKRCSSCHKNKDTGSFSKNKNTKDGLCVTCKSCAAIDQKLYNKKYPERAKEYRIANVDRIAAYQDKYYSRPEIIEQVKEYFKKRRITHGEELRRYARKYYKQNKQKNNKNSLDYYYRNRERILLLGKKKRDENKNLK